MIWVCERQLDDTNASRVIFLCVLEDTLEAPVEHVGKPS